MAFNMCSNLVLLVFLYCFSSVFCRLVVNVRNNGGEIYKEVITTNAESDTIQVQFLTTDGSSVSQLIDYRNELQIFRVVFSDEFEVNNYRCLCFLTSFSNDEFISVDAMSKLRQKNPGTVRLAETEKQTLKLEMDTSIDITKSSIISPHLSQLCHNDSLVQLPHVYVQKSNVQKFNQRLDNENDMLVVTNETTSLHESIKNCNEYSLLPIVDSTFLHMSYEQKKLLWKPCLCRLKICVPWYPCLLKYCKERDGRSGKFVSFRCGIHTCKRCYEFFYRVKTKNDCLWYD